MNEPRSDLGRYFFECCGGKFDGTVLELPDMVIDEGIDVIVVGGVNPGPGYKITDILLRPNVYKAEYIGIIVANR